MLHAPTFDVTIPVLNEEASLAQQVRLLHAFLKEQFPTAGRWKIVIADNGSTDRTWELANALQVELPEVQPLSVPRKGVGLALKTSWSQSDADIVGYMDLDLATGLQHFPEAMTLLTEGGCDLVYGTRLHPKSEVIGRSLKREITSRVFNTMVKLYLGTHFSDGMCGFKWLWRKHFRRLQDGGAVSDGWFFSTELLAVAEWQSLLCGELPVRWTDDTSSSRVRIVPLALQYLHAMKDLRKRKL